DYQGYLNLKGIQGSCRREPAGRLDRMGHVRDLPRAAGVRILEPHPAQILPGMSTRVIFDRFRWLCLPGDVRFTPSSTEALHCREMTRRAKADQAGPWRAVIIAVNTLRRAAHTDARPHIYSLRPSNCVVTASAALNPSLAVQVHPASGE